MSEQPPLLITRWASQQARGAPALAPGAALLDGRGFADLVAEAAHLAGSVDFVDETGVVAGDWRLLLAASPAAILALLATIDPDQRTQGLRVLLAEARAAATSVTAEELLAKLLHALFDVAAEIDGWMAPAEVAAGVRPDIAQGFVSHSIENILAPQLRALLVEVALAEEARLIMAVLPDGAGAGLCQRWRLALLDAELAAWREEHEAIAAHQLVDRVAEVAANFVAEIRSIAARAAAALDGELAAADHPPHVALVLAFAEVFAHAQGRLNAVPQRYAEFVRDEVWRAVPRAALPDRVLLSAVARPRGMAVIPRGTIIEAGKNASGSPIEFTADEDTVVTSTSVAGVRRWLPILGADGRVARVEVASITPADLGMLGASPSGIAGGPGETASPATVIACPAMMVDGATRRLVLTLACRTLPDAATPAFLERHLRIALSTATGWFDLTTHGVALAWSRENRSITASFDLSADVPPLAPCPPETLDAPAAAALRLSFVQGPEESVAAGQVTPSPWAVLGDIRLADAEIELVVKGLADLIVSVPGLPAGVGGAAPFGQPPVVGGTLRIDHPTLAAGPIERVLLTLDWGGLPPNGDGFTGYYRDYLVGADRQLRDRSPFTNAAFRVDLSTPVTGAGSVRDLPLFATAATPPPPDIAIAGNFAAAPEPEAAAPLTATSWFAVSDVAGNLTGTPYVELTLAAPQEAFGDAAYGPSLAYATMIAARGARLSVKPGLLWRLLDALIGFFEGIGTKTIAFAGIIKSAVQKLVRLPAKWLGRADPPAPPPSPAALPSHAPTVALLSPGPPILPNPAYRPMVTQVRLDLARRFQASAGALTLYHGLPLEPLGSPVEWNGAPLLAPLSNTATLDIALAGARAGEAQTLLVRLDAPSAPRDDVVFLYRAADGWAPLPAATMKDTTDGLAETGILGFIFPSDAVSVDDEPDCLRVRVVLPGASVPSIVSITANGLAATRRMQGAGQAVTTVAPGTIDRLPGVPGIARLDQPLASIGGAPAESNDNLGARMAERVRHRARAITGWDAERLVLDRFPAVAKVRVLPTGSTLEAPTGHLSLIALSADPAALSLAPALCSAIVDELGRAASPFARPRMVDPVPILVDVEVRLLVASGQADRAADPARSITALLSPLAEPGLDLDDGADVDDIRDAIAKLLRGLPGIVAIEHLTVCLRSTSGTETSARWHVPMPGNIAVSKIAAEAATLPW